RKWLQRFTRSSVRSGLRSTSRPGIGAIGSTRRRSRPARCARSPKCCATWTPRYREYAERIRTGSVLEIAKVLRDLFVLKGDKELSFGERKMLDTARNLLVKELAIAKSFSEEKIMEELRTIFAN